MVPTADPLAASFGIEAGPIPALTDEAWSRMLHQATTGPRARSLDHLVPGTGARPEAVAATDM
ncbi:hypothetical protein [Lolliginicoccus suaedae]|uniref:hypothetical protein n=1 Tax=Lolliginicoccus suaedae TaxID=2605429 RepID=UPI0011EBBBF2|nr:hypothetical protein [Lolliginicoccus suaedae]